MIWLNIACIPRLVYVEHNPMQAAQPTGWCKQAERRLCADHAGNNNITVQVHSESGEIHFRKVVPLLVMAFADTPARATWALTCGHSGRSGCDKCFMPSTRMLADGTQIHFNIYRAYVDAVLAYVYAGDRSGDQLLDRWQEMEIVYGDGKTFWPASGDRLLITDQKHRMRSLAADQATAEEHARRPLPPAATNPANVSQDPNSAVARGITRGTC